MEYGIKLWSTNEHWFQEAVDLYTAKEIDFVELYAIPDSLIPEKLEILKQVPITIHAAHEGHGLNMMQGKDRNAELIGQAIEMADYFGSDIIVLHPGVGDDFAALQKNLSIVPDKSRFYLENMPVEGLEHLGGGHCFGGTHTQIQSMLAEGFNFCLDFAHATKASITQQIDYKKFIEQIVHDFSPRYFHISDGDLMTPTDQHLNLGEGEFDLGFMKSLMSESDKLVFEVPKNKDDLKNDLKNIHYFKNL